MLVSIGTTDMLLIVFIFSPKLRKEFELSDPFLESDHKGCPSYYW